jgi:response regulator NasT
MLKDAGYDVIAEATNGIEAIALAKDHRPDLAILDVKMPELDGISAAEQIIEIAPVLMLTAFSQRELVERARDAGVMAYVVKPFSISDLVPAIEIAISRHSQMKSLAEEVADLHERLETRKVIDRAKGILMAALNLTEPQAFSWIQRAAMDRRISMKEVAQAVISPDAVPEK